MHIIEPKMKLARILNTKTMMWESTCGSCDIPDEIMSKGSEDFGLWQVLTWRDEKMGKKVFD